MSKWRSKTGRPGPRSKNVSYKWHSMPGSPVHGRRYRSRTKSSRKWSRPPPRLAYAIRLCLSTIEIMLSFVPLTPSPSPALGRGAPISSKDHIEGRLCSCGCPCPADTGHCPMSLLRRNVRRSLCKVTRFDHRDLGEVQVSLQGFHNLLGS